jgi:LysM repeat protein
MAALGVGGVQAVTTEEAAPTAAAPVQSPQAAQLLPATVDNAVDTAQAGEQDAGAAEAAATREAPATVPAATLPLPTATAVVAGLVARTTMQAPTPTWTPLATVAPEGAPVQLSALLPTPTATVTPVIYQVRRGDTLVGIAQRYNVSLDELMAFNSIGAREVTRIMPGRMLMIPVPTPTPLPTATPSPIRLAAPAPVSPEDGAQLDCLREERLQWERVQYVKDSDKYLLHLGFVSGYGEDGGERITWVVAQQRPVTVVEWTLDPALCSLAPQAYGRQWRWWVEVVADVEGALMPVSPPSPLWGFSWN